ncbi:hypothetical protein ACHWQZ_G014352 [Mnemiopsis leidyi]
MPMPLNNKHVHFLDETFCEPFNAKFVEQIYRATDSICAEMRECINVDGNDLVRAANMMKKTITREKLISWVETLNCILDGHVVPLLEKAVEMQSENQKLKDEKIKDHETIISLQNKLVEKKDEEISSMKSTVQTELKSYSSALSQSCKAALAPRKIEAAVKRVSDKEDRSRNVIIYGVKEESGEDLNQCIDSILTEIEEKPRIIDCCRIGNVKQDMCRPIKFTVSNHDHVRQILQKCKTLRNKEGYKSVYLSPDHTVDERKAFRKLLDELRQKRISEPEFVHILRNNKITSVPKDSATANTG